MEKMFSKMNQRQEAQAGTWDVETLSITEYAKELARGGRRVITGSAGAFWASYEGSAMMRVPTFHLVPPSADEVGRALWGGRAAVASYIVKPAQGHPVNAWSYVCKDSSYDLAKLQPPTRRNVRRGLRELEIYPISSRQLIEHGAQAYCDTRRRVGLDDGRPEVFQRRFTARANSQAHIFLGAWKGSKLAAFLSITQVEDWAEIEGCFSMTDLLNLRPNDALLYRGLYHYLRERVCRLVSYGLSSIQPDSNEAGLHAFKTKLGFEAIPVHRAFVPSPVLRPFVNRLVLEGVNLALRVKPGQRQLGKMSGLLTAMLEHNDDSYLLKM
jgi:hypothetical protein